MMTDVAAVEEKISRNTF